MIFANLQACSHATSLLAPTQRCLRVWLKVAKQTNKQTKCAHVATVILSELCWPVNQLRHGLRGFLNDIAITIKGAMIKITIIRDRVS